MPHAATLADAISFFHYWPSLLAAWALWGLIFGGIGLLAARFRWRGLWRKADELESEMQRFKNERNRLRALLREPPMKG